MSNPNDANKHSSKSRNERLRTSCDSCHLSKVKCSKTRPLCSRCLVCGTDCTYSPSARVGRRSKNGGDTSGHIVTHTINHRNGDQEQAPADAPSFQAPLYSKDEEAPPELNLDQSYFMTTPSSGYVTPAVSDGIDPLLFMDTQAASEAWIQTPATFDYLPWETDVLYSSLASPEILLSDPDISWSTWYDTGLDQVPYINPGTFYCPPDSSETNLHYNCQFSTNI